MTILLWGRIVRQVSLFLAAILIFAAASSSPSFASKCYGLDPCYACRNCSACMHCSQMGGKCGVCGGGKSAPSPRIPSGRTSAQSDLPAENFSPSRYPLRKQILPNNTLNQAIFPPAAPQFERPAPIERDASASSVEVSEPSDVSSNTPDLNQFPFDPNTGLPNPNYRGDRGRGVRNLRQESDFSAGGQSSVRTGIRSGPIVPSDGALAPYEQAYPYDQSPPAMPAPTPAYPLTPGFSGPSGYSSGSSGTQHVSGYYRKDGTYVHSYTRRSRSR